MTKRPLNRRTVLMNAGAAAVATVAGPVAGQSQGILGTVIFEGDGAIPKGTLKIYLEDLAVRESGRRRIATARIESDGGSKTIAFALPGPASSTGSAMLRIVARLERADGWLVARGSTQLGVGTTTSVTLHAAMY